MKLGQNLEMIILTKFHEDWTTNMDFFIYGKFLDVGPFFTQTLHLGVNNFRTRAGTTMHSIQIPCLVLASLPFAATVLVDNLP